MVGGIGTMVMAQSNYAALVGTRALYYAEYRFADVFARAKRAPLPLLEAVRAIPGVREAEARVTGFVNLELGLRRADHRADRLAAGPDDPA